MRTSTDILFIEVKSYFLKTPKSRARKQHIIRTRRKQIYHFPGCFFSGFSQQKVKNSFAMSTVSKKLRNDFDRREQVVEYHKLYLTNTYFCYLLQKLPKIESVWSKNTVGLPPSGEGVLRYDVSMPGVPFQHQPSRESTAIRHKLRPSSPTKNKTSKFTQGGAADLDRPPR